MNLPSLKDLNGNWWLWQVKNLSIFSCRDIVVEQIFVKCCSSDLNCADGSSELLSVLRIHQAYYEFWWDSSKPLTLGWLMYRCSEVWRCLIGLVGLGFVLKNWRKRMTYSINQWINYRGVCRVNNIKFYGTVIVGNKSLAKNIWWIPNTIINYSGALKKCLYIKYFSNNIICASGWSAQSRVKTKRSVQHLLSTKNNFLQCALPVSCMEQLRESGWCRCELEYGLFVSLFILFGVSPWGFW